MTRLDRIRNDIDTLAKYTSTKEGVTRLAFTFEELQAREYLKKEMVSIGLCVSMDTAGNLFGRRQGQDLEAPLVMIGSHIDTVVNGGKYDGAIGITIALEVARVLQEKRIVTKRPVEIAVFTEEEGGRFGAGLYGSRALVGNVSIEELYRNKNAHGISMAQAMFDFGLNPDKIGEAKREPGTIRAFIEPHIEQGPVLEMLGYDIGIVDSIVGIRVFNVSIYGQAAHAGTTPMNMRHDALVGASRVINYISHMIPEIGDNIVSTVGSLEVKPGAFNVVPAQVNFSIDLRDSSKAVMDITAKKIKDYLKETCHSLGLKYGWEERLYVPPLETDKEIADILENATKKLGLKSKKMQSGAGHDAMVIGKIAPVGMIFIPSRSGISHCPAEWTDYKYILQGAKVCLEAVLTIAQE